MSYWDIAEMSGSPTLQRRVSAAAAQEQDGEPVQWMTDHMLRLAAEPGWAEAWASAVAAGNEDPGRDAAVISDGMILSGVQALLAEPAA